MQSHGGRGEYSVFRKLKNLSMAEYLKWYIRVTAMVKIVPSTKHVLETLM
jgi:hypothetical protein